MAGDAVEIERKFLVSRLPSLDDAQRTRIRQGYLTQPSDSVEIRLRQKNDLYFLTLKSDGGAVRVEREAEISRDQFETLWPETEGRRVEKDRWTGRLSDAQVFELDLFAGDLEPLQLVEVEFASVADADAFVAPDWFGTDVTEDKRYKNKALALNGKPG